MHAFLITGGTKTERIKEINKLKKEWGVAGVDIITLAPPGTQGPSIGIADVRDLENKLFLKPFQSSLTLAVVEDAHTLTLEAQQALLKTLEEPPVHARLILETGNSHTLLPTIVSRCQPIQLAVTQLFDRETMFQCFKTLKQAQNAKIGERLRLSSLIATNKQQALMWTEACLEAVYLNLHGNGIPLPQAVRVLRLLLAARQQLLGNVNPILTIDHLFLSL